MEAEWIEAGAGIFYCIAGSGSFYPGLQEAEYMAWFESFDKVWSVCRIFCDAAFYDQENFA